MKSNCDVLGNHIRLIDTRNKDLISEQVLGINMKCRYLQELNHGGGVVFATGTPISNSITELFVWQYLLQKQTLDDMNISYFDNWASVYGVVRSQSKSSQAAMGSAHGRDFLISSI